MELVLNIPLDIEPHAALLTDQEELYLTWPGARCPFDRIQWREVMDPVVGHHPFLVRDGDKIVGQAALLVGEEPGQYHISFIYLKRDFRGQGRGSRLIAMLEDFAAKQLSARVLTLTVRDFNVPALNCYRRCGYEEYVHEGTRVRLRKALPAA